jgi:hypothetical protein
MKRFFPVRFVVVCVLMVMLCICSGCGNSGGGSTVGVVLSENFDGFTTGTPFTSSSWTDINGGALPAWNVQEAGKALEVDTAGFIVYAGSGSSGWTNYTLTFNFKVEDKSIYATAMFRFIGGVQPSYYFINIVQTGGTDTLSLGKATGGGSFGITSSTISYSANTYYPVRIVVNGNNIKVYFNGASTPDIDYTDDGSSYGALQPAGSVGLGSSNGSIINSAFFDDLVVTTF